ncbi:MAG: glycoside hydrolase family 27 protein [Oscillospiraceae bacterium]|nr:glycoside hydrolase family 27 protein [Oscillospiraceae bacterium]
MITAKYPPMGWNSWDCYGAAVDEKTVKANADYMAKNLRQYGWEYIVVDIEWYQPTVRTHEYLPFAELVMDKNGRLMPAENRFPSAKDGKGFAPLAEYVHSLGLKFGIHIMRGIPRQAVHEDCPVLGSEFTARQVAEFNDVCEWNPDMYGLNYNCKGAEDYYNSIFKLYAEWGVDFVKVDDIARNNDNEGEIMLIANAIKNSGREMVLSLSPGPAKTSQAEFLKKYANMWRITDDFWDKWELLYAMFERAEAWCNHSGPGHWPDCDMLPIGPINQVYSKDNRTNFTRDEQKTMMSLWCMMRSPLMIGGELNGFDEFTLSLVTNPELLEIEKTTFCAHMLERKEVDGCETITWFAPRVDGTGGYLALFNAGEKPVTISVPLDSIGITAHEAYDIWEKTTEPVDGAVSEVVEKHGVKLVRLK